MLETQAQLSRIPTPKTLLIERLESREGQHLFLYPFAGGTRTSASAACSPGASRRTSRTPSRSSSTTTASSCSRPGRSTRRRSSTRACSSEGDLLHDVLASLNSSELARRRFREIARVSGLISQGFPGQPKSARQLQASSSLFYEVFRKYDARQPAARPGRERGAQPGARHQAAARGAAAHARAAGRLRASSRCRARSRCR